MLRRPFHTRRCRLALASIVGLGAVGALTVATAVPAGACGGLVGENGTIQLVRTTTLAAYHDGVERYVTSFEFTGEGEEVGSIVPLPDVPTDVERGGDWTLQRLAAGGRTAVRRRRARATPRRRPRRPAPRSSSRPRSTPSTSPSSRAAATRSASGRSTTASSSRPTRPRCSTSTPSAARSSWPRSSTPAARPSARPDQPATARRSCSRSRPTSRGCRCASSASASTATSRSRPTCSCSPTTSRSCSPAGPGLSFDRSEAASTLAARRPALRRGHGVGAGATCGCRT